MVSYNYILFILILLFNGCAKNEHIIIKENNITPRWYIENNINDNLNYYKSKKSNTKRLSLRIAIEDIKDDIYKDIFNIYNDNINMNDLFDFYKNELTILKISNKLKKIDIPYKVINILDGNNNYYVEINVKKIDIFNLLKESIDKDIDMFNDKLFLYNNIFEKILFYKYYIDKLQDLNLKLLILKILNKDFNIEKYILLKKSTIKYYKKELENINFKFKFIQNNKKFIKIIQEELGNNYFSLNNNNRKKIDYLFTFRIKDKKESNIDGLYIIKMNIIYDIKNKNKTLIEKDFVIEAKSKIGFEKTIEKIYIKFENIIKNRLFD